MPETRPNTPEQEIAQRRLDLAHKIADLQQIAQTMMITAIYTSS